MKYVTLILVSVFLFSFPCQSQTESIFDPYYYEHSIVRLGLQIDEHGQMEGENTSFSLNGKPLKIFILVEQDKSLMLKKLVVEIYDEEALKKIDTFVANVADPNWSWVKISYVFLKPGKYYIDMYNEEDTYVNTAYLTITE